MFRRLIPFVILGYFIVQGLLLISLLVWGLGLNAEVTRLTQSFQKTFPSSFSSGGYKASLDQLFQRAQAELARLKVATVIEKDKFRIAGKMAGIVRTVPVRTWISSIQLDTSKRSMSIKACFLADAMDSDALSVTHWIEALKKDPGFGPGLKTIGEVSSYQIQKGAVEISLSEIQAGW